MTSDEFQERCRKHGLTIYAPANALTGEVSKVIRGVRRVQIIPAHLLRAGNHRFQYIVPDVLIEAIKRRFEMEDF